MNREETPDASRGGKAEAGTTQSTADISVPLMDRMERVPQRKTQCGCAELQ
jgi:hypothetical protein